MATLSYFLFNDVASISISSDTVLAGLVQLTSRSNRPLIVVIVQLTYQGIAGLAGVASYGGSGELWARGRASWQPFIWPSWRARSVRPIKTGNHPLDTRTRKYMLVWAIKFNLPTVNHTSFDKCFIDFHPWLAEIGKLSMTFCPSPPPHTTDWTVPWRGGGEAYGSQNPTNTGQDNYFTLIYCILQYEFQVTRWRRNQTSQTQVNSTISLTCCLLSIIMSVLLYRKNNR